MQHMTMVISATLLNRMANGPIMNENTKANMVGIVISEVTVTMTANEAQIEGTGEKVNLFDYHVKADTILFQYVTPDGRDEVVKFPLAGFCENYLMQFVK